MKAAAHREVSRCAAEMLRDLRLVHEHRAFGVSDLIDNEAELEEATRAVQRFSLCILDSPAPLRLTGMTMHIPPNCPFHDRVSLCVQFGAATSGARTLT